MSDSLTRRQFLRAAGAGAAVAAAGGASVLVGCEGRPMGPGDGLPRSLLAMPPNLPAAGAALTAAPGAARIADGESAPAWLFNGALPGPTLRARHGDRVGIRLHNGLPEPTIVHWHGLIVPEQADGHPRYAIGPGATFDYAFPLVQRAGTFWYHPHPHHRTAGQVHRGLAGFFLVGDEEEDALGLPSGAREVLLLLQDRDGDPASALSYAPTTSDLHTGMLRDVPFGNGIRLPRLEVMGARYRLRVLNASQARVYRLALDGGVPLTVIGNDGGLLAAPAEADSVFLGVGERVDLLVDFSPYPAGARVMLRSLPFVLSSSPDGPSPQGVPLDLLELVRTPADGPADAPLPPVLSSIAPLPAPAATREFVFRSTALGDMHRINGHSFELDRVDEEIPLGRVERWAFVNDSALPHPVHLHGTQFQVAARTGGRNLVEPYEGGWKDTVLVMPLETVEVLVRFERYPGLFPLHCHNLQHEDMGMMLNVNVV